MKGACCYHTADKNETRNWFSFKFLAESCHNFKHKHNDQFDLFELWLEEGCGSSKLA